MGITPKPKGFSLLEVMVAVAILAVSLLAMINFQGQTMWQVGKAEKITVATLLAQDKMAEIILEIEKEWEQQKVFPEDKSEGGTFDDPFDRFSFEWELRKVKLPMPAGEEGGPAAALFQMIDEQIKEAIREIRLTIKWEGRGKERDIEVVTHITKL